MIRPARTVTDRARAWWTTLSFGARAPRRRLATLALLGLATGIGESAVVVLLVALASCRHGGRLPLNVTLPGSPWELAAIALLAAAGLALAHLARRSSRRVRPRMSRAASRRNSSARSSARRGPRRPPRRRASCRSW